MSRTTSLQAAIATKTASVVVVGMGYVGLPVACAFGALHFSVTGLDCDEERVQTLLQGRTFIHGKEPHLAELWQGLFLAGQVTATLDYSVCHTADVIIVAVQTPVESLSDKPDYSALSSAILSIGQQLKPGTLVIIESTLAPGTMNQVVCPGLETISRLRNDEDFYLVHCPERLTPGNLLRSLVTRPRVVGGSEEATALAQVFYKHLVIAKLDVTDWVTAETVKVAENAYRDVQIAFANELAMICEAVGVDIWEARQLINKAPYRDVHLPGAGVGGGCLPKDPLLLVHSSAQHLRLIQAAREVNDGMPGHIADRAIEFLKRRGIDAKTAKVVVLGQAYLENLSDDRNSPTCRLVTRLVCRGVDDVTVHDPYVEGYQGDWLEMIQGSDALIVMVAHDTYKAIQLADILPHVATPILIDGRRVFGDQDTAKWDYYCVGDGNTVPDKT